MGEVNLLAPTRIFAFLALMLVFTAHSYGEPLRMVTGNNGVAKYAKGLLKIALSKIPNDYVWDESTERSTEARIVEYLKVNKLDIVWYSTSKDFEEQLRPIRVPIFRGLLGFRIFMIKRGTQHLFEGITTLDDLNRISIAQGRFWADTRILEANGVNVVKVTKYDSLFHMLDGERFDAFPRGVHEPWYELAKWPDLDLDVEDNIMLVYTSPFYFFVNKNNTKLAKDLERGLRIAIEDGSFEEYFMKDPVVQDVIKNANVQNRILIKLTNPLLPESTPLEDETLWFNPYAL